MIQSSVQPTFRPEVTVGSILGSGYRAFKQHSWSFLAMQLLTMLPMIAVFALVFTIGGVETGELPLWFQPLNILASFVAQIGFAAAVHATVNIVHGRPMRMSESLSVGASRFLPLVGVSFLYGLCVLLGLLGLIVGAVVVAVMLFPALPVAVMERRGAGAIGRAAALSKGHRMTMFLAGLCYSLLSGLFVLGVGVVAGFVTAGLASTGSVGAAIGAALMIALLGTAYLVVMALYPIMAAVVYEGLRADKDGPAADHLTGVFS